MAYINNNSLVFNTHVGGIYSNSNVILSHIINFFNDRKCLPDNINTDNMFLLYKLGNDNIYNKFFIQNLKEIIFKKKIVFNDEGYENQFSNYKLLKLHDIKPFIDKYFTPNETILNNIDYLLCKYKINLDDEICGVFYRGNDKIMETQKPPYDEFVKKAKDLINNNPNIKFIVQTDETEFLTYFLNYFPDAIYFSELKTISCNSNSNVVRNLNNENKIDHVKHFISIIQIFSKLKYLITTSGNCELFITFYRNNTNNLYQYLKKNKYVHGGLNIDYVETEQIWY
jgi:hypothetical protein